MQKTVNTGRITAHQILDELVNLSQIVFEVTDACNLSCKYCAYGDLYGGYDKRHSQYLDFDVARTVIDYLVDIWKTCPQQTVNSTTIIGFYGGEPLLNFKLIQQVIAYVEQIDSPRAFGFSMTSNCLLLDRYMDYLVEKDFSLLCSLDGDEIGDGYRVFPNGKPSFKKVFSNIKALREKHPEYFAKRVSFNTVLHNLNSVASTAAFIREHFGKTPSFSELSTVGVRPDRKDAFERTFKRIHESIHEAPNYEELRQELGTLSPEVDEIFRFIERVSGNSFPSYAELLSETDCNCVIPTGTCIPFNRKMFVKVDGKILQCERIPHNRALGEVKNGVVSLDFERIASWFNSYLDKIQPQCGACGNKSSCVQCMLQIDELESNHPQCPGFITEELFQNYRNYCLSYLHQHPELYRQSIEEVTYV